MRPSIDHMSGPMPPFQTAVPQVNRGVVENRRRVCKAEKGTFGDVFMFLETGMRFMQIMTCE